MFADDCMSLRAASVTLPDIDGYRERLGHLVDRQLPFDRERHGQDQFARPRRHDHAAEHDPCAVAGEQLDEPVT